MRPLTEAHNPGVAKRVHVDLVREGEVDLAEGEARHLRDVLRMGPGEAVEVFDNRGYVGRALVTEVQAASPAVRAGLRPGDVIVSWNGQPVDARSLPLLVSRAPIGKKVAVSVWRSGALVPLTVELMRAPD